MNNRNFLLEATISETLLYYDGPQLVLLSGANGDKGIAVAITRDGMEYPFFACYIHQKILEKYLIGKVDLYYLFSNASSSAYYFFDLFLVKNDIVSLERVSEDEAQNKDYWPEKGFFSSNHSSVLSSRTEDPEYININGAWDMSELSLFFKKFSEIYAILFIVNFNVRKLKKLISSRYWQGGGSYLSFYDSLMEEVENSNLLTLKSIQYASPGKLGMVGNTVVINKVVDLIQIFENHSVQALQAYRSIDRILNNEKLKSSEASTNFSSQSIENYVKNQADIILNALGIDTQNNPFFDACNCNVLIYSKLVLSIHRRVDSVHNFISEGRVQLT
ncbi:MAG: hypothetical protein HQL93_09800 [Magnetococcales bacterium]|nr:hypothetical protein [Magnetococcales bacterium]